jgi:hypothetical protein
VKEFKDFNWESKSSVFVPDDDQQVQELLVNLHEKSILYYDSVNGTASFPYPIARQAVRDYVTKHAIFVPEATPSVPEAEVDQQQNELLLQ